MYKLQKKIDTTIGPLYLEASYLGLHGIHWTAQPAVPMVESINSEKLEIKILLKTEQQLNEYFSGKRQDFDLPMAIEGTEFQKLVWAQLLRIPYGVTKSYKDIAIALNKPGASRAVGNANSQNPFSIIIPCHRVIAADGSLGGYAGGLDIKTKLLAIEAKKL